MSATQITVTGSFERPNDESAQGGVIATLSTAIQNGTEIVEPTPILGTLNEEGKLVSESLEAFKLVANDDPATTPTGSTYLFVIELDNAPVRSFSAVVPHTAPGGTIDLSTLEG